MNRLLPVISEEDIIAAYQSTPIADLFRYHNLEAPFNSYTSARMLIGMCMDNRKQLRIPDNFAYIIRTGGANLRYSEFKVSFAIAVGGVHAIALIGHTHCGMVNLASRQNEFIDGLVTNAGWEMEKAEEHFHQFAPLFEISNAIDFVLSESKRLRERYPRVIIAPLMYKVEDNKLYHINEEC